MPKFFSETCWNAFKTLIIEYLENFKRVAYLYLNWYQNLFRWAKQARQRKKNFKIYFNLLFTNQHDLEAFEWYQKRIKKVSKNIKKIISKVSKNWYSRPPGNLIWTELYKYFNFEIIKKISPLKIDGLGKTKSEKLANSYHFLLKVYLR